MTAPRTPEEIAGKLTHDFTCVSDCELTPADMGWLKRNVALAIAQERAEADKWRKVVENDCETEAEFRKLAMEVLPDVDVNGDGYGVPTIADIGEMLVTRIVKHKGVTP